MERNTQAKVAGNVSFAFASFGMTLTRLVVALCTGLLIISNGTHSKEMIVLAVLFIMVFDYYDGKLFERSFLRDQSEWRLRRRIFDAVSDRLVIQLVCIPVLFADHSFLWVYVSILVREVLVSGYNVAQRWTKGAVIYPGPIAKWACVAVGVATIAFLTAANSIVLFSTILMLAMCPFAVREYHNKLKQYETSAEAGRLSREPVTEVF